jgi:hypothetical protein
MKTIPKLGRIVAHLSRASEEVRKATDLLETMYRTEDIVRALKWKADFFDNEVKYLREVMHNGTD